VTAGTDVPVMRVPISLPCQVPVLPGTPDTTAPIEQRTERCAVDAFWIIGRAMICDLHLRVVLGDDYAPTVAQWPDLVLSARETVPWVEMHRYDQASAQPDWPAG
jgi:hypothetical protein